MLKLFSRWRRDHRDRQMRFLTQAVQLEEAVNPYIARMSMTLVSSSILVFLLWSSVTNINEVARAPGEVVPQGKEQLVQHLEGGIVETIMVSEGEIVSAGQPLLRLSDSTLVEDFRRLQAQEKFLGQQVERFRAFIEGREPDFGGPEITSDEVETTLVASFESMRDSRQKDKEIILDQLSQKREVLAGLGDEHRRVREKLVVSEEIYAQRLELAEKGLFPRIRLMEEELELKDLRGQVSDTQNRINLTRNEIQEFNSRLESLGALHRDQAHERLDVALAEYTQNENAIGKMQERLDRLVVRAPTAGRVVGLNVNTLTEVVSPGETLLRLVPQDKSLEVHVKISPRDIGYLEIGQPVQVKFSSFDFSRFGSAYGELSYLSATTFAETNGARFYKGSITLERDYVGADPRNRVMPGMTVMADIVTGEKTIFQYLLKPITNSLKTAFTER